MPDHDLMLCSARQPQPSLQRSTLNAQRSTLVELVSLIVSRLNGICSNGRYQFTEHIVKFIDRRFVADFSNGIEKTNELFFARGCSFVV